MKSGDAVKHRYKNRSWSLHYVDTWMPIYGCEITQKDFCIILERREVEIVKDRSFFAVKVLTPKGETGWLMEESLSIVSTYSEQ